MGDSRAWWGACLLQPGAEMTRSQTSPRNGPGPRVPSSIWVHLLPSACSCFSGFVPFASAAVAACLLLLPFPLRSAQTAVATAQQPIETTADLVKVDVSVLDGRGNFVGGLAENDFHVLDNGVEQPLLIFTPVDAPARILVVIETSPAVYLIHTEHLVAAYALLQGLSPDDQVALVAYDESPHLILPFTPDKSALLAALGDLQYNIGMSELNFYDSLSAVLDWFGPAAEKRALVLLTTGLDSSPPGHWSALVQKLRREDAVIFSVALGGPLRSGKAKKPRKARRSNTGDSARNGASAAPSSSLSFANADKALRSLAAITGGRAYFPDSDKDFVPIYHEIASALRHQYVLGIAPARDGQFHSLTVEIADSKGTTAKHGSKNPYVIFARQGYLAPGHE
jgi:Ca-activated chloride channel homolog